MPCSVRSLVFCRLLATTSSWPRPRALGVSVACVLAIGCGADAESAIDDGRHTGGSSATGGQLSTGGNLAASGGSAPGGSGGSPAGLGGGAGGTSDTGGSNTGSNGTGGAGTGGAGTGGAGTGAGGDGTGGDAGNAARSAGCGKEPTLQSGSVDLQSGGANRRYVLSIPDDYDPDQAYRLIFGLHGANGESSQVAPSHFGLLSLSQGSAIFIAPDAVGGLWKSEADLTFMDDILIQVKTELCIDTGRVQLQGFSQGGAMSWVLACSRPGVYRSVVAYSPGGMPRPATCEPVAFMFSLGQSEVSGQGQTHNSDFFAGQNGCTVEPLPKAPSGGHLCTYYRDCSPEHPTRWCDYDGGHTPSPTDAGQNMSWMPDEAWAFISQF